MKVIIVGGVAGGATAAARIRRLDEQAEIVVYERSGFVSYANCGLPYYIGGAITDPGDLTLQTPESFRARFRIEMKVRHEVQSIVPEEKTVTVRNLETGETFTDRYDKLLLSPGARPTQPSLPGMDLERLFTLRTVEDALKIRAFVEEKKPRSAVLAGGGFIGLEVAENLREQGLEVTIVQKPPQVLAPLDGEMAAFYDNERNYIGLLLTRKDCLGELLKAKYRCLCLTLALPAATLLPAVATGKLTWGELLAGLLTASGTAAFMLFQLAAHNRQAMPLDDRGGRKTAANATRKLATVAAVLALPCATLGLVGATAGHGAAIATLAATGAALTLTHRLWLSNIHKRMLHTKYEMAEGFNASLM